MSNAIPQICSQDIYNWYREKAPKKKIDLKLAEKCAGVVEEVLQLYIKKDAAQIARLELNKIFTDEASDVYFFQYVVPVMIKEHAKISISFMKYLPNQKKNCVIIYSRDAFSPPTITAAPVEKELNLKALENNAEKDIFSFKSQSQSISPKKPDEDVIKICSQDILNWYFEKAPNRKIDVTIAEKCAGVVEEVLGLYTKKDAKQIARLTLKQIFADNDSEVFFFQFAAPKLIHDHAQISIALKKYSRTDHNGCVIIYSKVGFSLIPKLAVSIYLPIDTTTKILDLATSVANEFYLKCLEKQEEKDSFSITIQSSTIFPGKSEEDVLKNCEFYLFTLPNILEKKGIVIFDASTKQIVTENQSYFITTFYKSNTIPLLNQLCDMFEKNAEDGFNAIIKRCHPIYEGESDEIILKNSEFYAATLPKLLESRNIFLRDVVVQFLDSDKEYLIYYFRKTETLSNNNSTQKTSKIEKGTVVEMSEKFPYSKFKFDPSNFSPDNSELFQNEEKIDTTSHLSNSSTEKTKSFITLTLDMNNAKVRMFSRGSLRDLTLVADSKPNLEIKAHPILGKENILIIESKEKIPNKN